MDSSILCWTGAPMRHRLDPFALSIVTAALLFLLCAAPAIGLPALFVDADACPGPGTGTQADPFCKIQDGIDVAGDTDTVLVSPGTYSEIINFNGKAITLVSTDGQGVTTIDGTGLDSSVVTCASGEGPDTVLEGFTITGGIGTPDVHDRRRGGGMYNENSSPMVANCTFTGNSARYGGGMYNTSDSSPTVTNCTFSENSASAAGGGMYNERESSPTVTGCRFSENSAGLFGGGMRNEQSSPTLTNCTFLGNSAGSGGGMQNVNYSSPTVTDCTFSENSAGLYGGGMSNRIFSSPTVADCEFRENVAESGGGMDNRIYCSPTLTNSTFTENSAGDEGGGMFSRDSSPMLANSTFSGNSASAAGGGMYYEYFSSAALANCTFSGNSAPIGLALACDSYQHSRPSTVVLTNCILWDGDGSTITITYSDVQGGWTNDDCPATDPVCNIDADPLFVDADDLDDVPGTEDDNLRLLPDSPCIDAGDNEAVPDGVTTDLDGNPRIANGIVDMGAYEAPAAIVYVDSDATGASNGTSWEDAYTDLQDALTEAEDSGGDVTQIWVAAGTYLPSARTYPDEPRSATFHLLNGVGLYGGFAGTETDLDQRNPSANRTVLSGDLDGNDAPFSDVDPWEDATRSDNSLNVVTGFDIDATAVLDGFTITGGHADGELSIARGAGMTVKYGDPTVIDCTFVDNWALHSGGGMYNEGSGPTLIDCTFRHNMANSPGARCPAGGGGIYNDAHGRNPMLINCRFQDNSAAFGGGMLNYECSPTLINCTFAGNTADAGGGLHNSYSYNNDVTLIECTFTGNIADMGGGLDNSSSNATLINCAFTGNTADRGGGMTNHGGDTTLVNCTFSYNHAEDTGGGIDSWPSILTLMGCIFNDNSAGLDGGGVYGRGGYQTMVDCVFRGNWAESDAGAMYIQSSSLVIGCTFIENRAGDFGGGVYSDLSWATLTSCVFIRNSAFDGGGVYDSDGSSTFSRCMFHENFAWSAGGGMYADNGAQPALRNCLFNGNLVGWGGGGICSSGSAPTLTGCTFTANSAAIGRALATNWWPEQDPSTVQMANCILWNGEDEVFNADDSTIMITYSNIQGGWGGNGNIDTDPQFADAHGPDGVPGTADDDLRLSPQSPALDAGDPDFASQDGEGDLDGHSRVLCGRVDMGAYEFGIGDFDCDNSVDLYDFASWDLCFTGPEAGPFPVGCEAFDFDADVDVDLGDFGGFQLVYPGYDP